MEKTVEKWWKGETIGMLLGTYKPRLIGERRMALPGKIRKEIKGNKVILAVGFERCILGFEEKEWEKVTATDLSRPLSDAEGRELRRKMFAGAAAVELGVQGRFVIPESMIEYAGIRDKLTLIGAGDHFEIWAEEKWSGYSEKIKKEEE